MLPYASGDIVSPISCAFSCIIAISHSLCLDVHLDSVDVDDVAPPTIKLNYAKRYASLLSSF